MFYNYLPHIAYTMCSVLLIKNGQVSNTQYMDSGEKILGESS